MKRELEKIKFKLVAQFFWGRSAGYKTFIHILVLVTTAFFTLFGVANRFVVSSDVGSINSNLGGDVLTSGNNIQAQMSSSTDNTNILRVQYHTVVKGDTLSSLAKKYNLTENTIHWANIRQMGPFSSEISEGWILKIPPIDGVLYKVKSGDTIWSVAENLKADVFLISEINTLSAPDYSLTVGDDIMIPNAKLENWDKEVQVSEAQLAGAFEDPLSNPACNGYYFYGGINSYPGHNGVDAGIPLGCPIRSIAAGTVYFVGWEEVSGYTVKIDHGGGIKSYYYHGDGQIWVKVGERVGIGQDIMFMGCTGNCFGTHLHLTIKLNGAVIDPVRYIGFKGV